MKCAGVRPILCWLALAGNGAGTCFDISLEKETMQLKRMRDFPSRLLQYQARSATGDDAKAIAKRLRDWVCKEIGPTAKPKDIRFGDNLPKTRSGKIMRRLLRSVAMGEPITQDTSTLENPAVLDQLGQSN